MQDYNERLRVPNLPRDGRSAMKKKTNEVTENIREITQTAEDNNRTGQPIPAKYRKAEGKAVENKSKRNFTLCQQNGQRTYGGPPPNWGSRPPPSRDCEVFIGRIPRMCFEDELIPLFLSVGELYEFRLMLDFSGTNRGYGYAHYATYQGAMNAIKILNRYEIRPGHHIGVLKSKNNCRLLFGNIKSGVTYETFNDFIRTATGQVLNVFMFSNFDQLRTTDLSISLEVEEAFLERMPRNNSNCQFAIVEYENHKAAAVARRILIPKYGHILAIDWAVPPRERRRSVQGDGASSVPSRNLPVSVYKSRLAPMKFSTKARPVPTLVTRPSIFDNLPYMPKAFCNILKYFKFLINVTLHRSVQRGEIPVSIYLELEKKILERITNLENCGQAVQLIFNYLSWYNEKKITTIDGESQKILQEVKIYSDSLVHFIFNKITHGKSLNPELEDYYCNILPLQLNFIFHMTMILTGEDRSKVCGRITVSLQWFNEILQKVKAGDVKMKEFLMHISRIDEGGSAKCELSQLWSSNQSRLLNAMNQPCSLGFGTALQDTTRNNPFRTRSLAGSSVSRNQTFIEDLAVENSLDHDFKENVSIPKCMNFQSEELSGYPNGLERFGSVSITNSQASLQTGNVLNGFKQDFWDEICGSIENGNEQKILGFEENFFDPAGKNGLDLECKTRKLISVLNAQPSVTENVRYMPKAFYNVPKYFKYIINWNLQKMVEKSELSVETYKEIETKIINNIVNLESCGQAVDLITDCLRINENEELFKILQDVKIYSNSFINFICNRESYGPSPNRNLDDYYCRVLPCQLSFIFHLALIVNGDEKYKLSGRVTIALQWLNELIRKNKTGDVEVAEFFEQISAMGVEKGEGSNEDTVMRYLLREAIVEFNVIAGASDTSNLF